MKTIKALVFAASTMLAAGAASAATVTIDFAGTGSPTTSKTFSSGGVGVTATSARFLFGAFQVGGTVTQTAGGGLGVGGLPVFGIPTDTNGEIDGLGFHDALILTFNQLVADVSTLFRGIDANGSDDWDVFVDDGSGVFTRIADDSTTNNLLAGGLVKRIAYLADNNNDDFRVRSVTLSTVPLPAAGWLLIAGVGGLVFVRRRQKAA